MAVDLEKAEDCIVGVVTFQTKSTQAPHENQYRPHMGGNGEALPKAPQRGVATIRSASFQCSHGSSRPSEDGNHKYHKTLYETWNINRYTPPTEVEKSWWALKQRRHRPTELVVAPINWHSQAELDHLVTHAESDYLHSVSLKASSMEPATYSNDLHQRIVALEPDVKRRMEQLVAARIEANTSMCCHRLYKVAYLRIVPGSESSLTGFCGGLLSPPQRPAVTKRPWYRRFMAPNVKSHSVDYQIILQGCEVMQEEGCWDVLNERARNVKWDGSSLACSVIRK
ncbi:unnamed protein product [Discula destructiva]